MKVIELDEIMRKQRRPTFKYATYHCPGDALADLLWGLMESVHFVSNLV